MKHFKMYACFLLAAAFVCLTACGTTPATTESTTTGSAVTTAHTEVTTMNTTNATTTASTAATTATKAATTQATSAATTATAATTAEKPAEKPVASFDENNIVLSFAALTDCHIGNSYNSTEKLASALRQLKADAELDVVCFDGDMTDTGTQAQIDIFKKTLESVYPAGSVQLFYAIGNHEHVSYSTDGSAATKRYYDTFGASYFANDLSGEEQILSGNRHIKVNGYHFLTVEPYTYGSTSTQVYEKYTAKTLEWLETTLSEIAKEDPDSYIFVFTHPMPYNTCYGSDLDGKDSYWNTTQLDSILEKYPQVVTFGGHLHYPLNDERSIMQGSFTALGCGSVSYMAIEAGNYIDMSSRTVMKDAGEYSEGLLCQVDKDGNMRITRYDFYREQEIKTAWIIPAPQADGSHLTYYSADRGSTENNKAPVAGEASFVTTASGSSQKISLQFHAATDDDMIHDYTVNIYRGDKLLFTRNILADFYRSPDLTDMKELYTVECGKLMDNCEYKAEIIARDSWGAEDCVTVTYPAK